MAPVSLGTNFVHYWPESYPGDRVVALNALTYAGNLASLEPVRSCEQFRFVHGDIRDQKFMEDLISAQDINSVVDFAAESHVDRSIMGPDPFIETNINGAHDLLKVVPNTGPKKKLDLERCRFHQGSTDEVYGSLGPDDPAFSEVTRHVPPYPASKAACDQLDSPLRSSASQVASR